MKSNKGVIIALIKNVGSKEPVGYRIIFDGAVKNVPKDSLMEAMEKSDCVENAKVENGKLLGTQGAMERYPVITPNNSVVKGGVTIVNKYGMVDRNKQIIETVYEIADARGRVEMCTDGVALQYAEENGLANGKIVTKGDTKFISAINGEYHYEEVMEEAFCIDHNIKGYTSRIELRLQNLAISKAKEKKIEIERKKKQLVEDVTQQFNVGVVSALLEYGLEYQEINVLADLDDKNSATIEAIQHKLKMGVVPYTVRHSAALIKEDSGEYKLYHRVEIYNQKGEPTTAPVLNKGTLTEAQQKSSQQNEEQFKEEMITKMKKEGRGMALALIETWHRASKPTTSLVPDLNTFEMGRALFNMGKRKK